MDLESTSKNFKQEIAFTQHHDGIFVGRSRAKRWKAEPGAAKANKLE